MKIWFAFFCLCLVIILGFIDGKPTPYLFPDLPTFPQMPTSPVNPVTKEGALLGRYLFYDPILSRDSSVSCSSCHKQEHAFSDAPVQFSTGIKNTPLKRNTLPLFNLAWYPSFFWDGRATSLEEQVLFPVRTHDEMDLDWKRAVNKISRHPFYHSRFRELYGNIPIDSILITKTIAQFLRTLLSYQSRFDRIIQRKARITAEEYKGFELMNSMTQGDCLHCHTTDPNSLTTTAQFSNNGLDSVTSIHNFLDAGLGSTTQKSRDYGKFKIPSLRNIALTAPYMHDGRFKTLEEVLDFYSEGVKRCVNIDSKMEFAHIGGAHLTSEEKKNIITFLKTLTDSVFISNPEFSNPFHKQ